MSQMRFLDKILASVEFYFQWKSFYEIVKKIALFIFFMYGVLNVNLDRIDFEDNFWLVKKLNIKEQQTQSIRITAKKNFVLSYPFWG